MTFRLIVLAGVFGIACTPASDPDIGAMNETSRHLQETSSPAPAFADARLKRVAERLDAAAAEGASGILRISLGGTLLFESGFGSAACDSDEPVTHKHLFMIGSITKDFTRLLGFVLEERGAISLDDRVSRYLTALDGPVARVTLRQLMDHTAGLPDIIGPDGRPVSYTVEYDYESVSRDELIERAGRAELIGEPGGESEYSNLGYQLLAATYEVASGDSFPNLLERYVFEPAGLDRTGFWFDDAARPPIADGCRRGGERWGNPVDDGMWDAAGPSWNLIGAGGLLSTAASLERFFEGIATGIYFEDTGQHEAYKASRLVYSERRRQPVMGPAGSNGIFNAAAFWANDDRFAVILMTNRANHPAEGGLFRDIVGEFPPESFLDPDDLAAAATRPPLPDPSHGASRQKRSGGAGR